MSTKPKSAPDWIHQVVSDPPGFAKSLFQKIIGSNSTVSGDFTAGFNTETLERLNAHVEEYLRIRSTEAEAKIIEAKARLVESCAELIRQTTNAEALERLTGGDPQKVAERIAAFFNHVGNEHHRHSITITEIPKLPSGRDDE